MIHLIKFKLHLVSNRGESDKHEENDAIIIHFYYISWL